MHNPGSPLLSRLGRRLGGAGVVVSLGLATVLVGAPAASASPWDAGSVTPFGVEDPGTFDETTSGVPTPRELPPEPSDEYFMSPRDLTGCPFAESPPPAVNDSEDPEPGEPVPSPPPVPDEPVGGEQLGGCEVVAADGFAVPETVTASGWVVADLDSGEVLAAQDPHGRYRPASTIKMLLALVAVDELDGDEVISVTDADIAESYGSLVGVGPGGEYTVDQLMSGLLMTSGNDAADVLAERLGGREAVLEKMQERAESLGTTSTQVTSVSGLDAPGFMSSAYDMALISRAAFTNGRLAEYFQQEAVGFPGYPVGEGAEAPDPFEVTEAPTGPTVGVNGEMVQPGFVVYNDNQLLHQHQGTIGGKTGFTDLARQTYIGAAEEGDRRLVAVLLDGTPTPASPWEQARDLLDAGFATAPGDGVGMLVDGPGESRSGEDASRVAGPLGALGTGEGESAGITGRVAEYWPWAVGALAGLGMVILLFREGSRR